MPIMCVPLPFLSPAQENKALQCASFLKMPLSVKAVIVCNVPPLALSHHFYWLARFPLHVLLTSPPEEMSNT